MNKALNHIQKSKKKQKSKQKPKNNNDKPTPYKTEQQKTSHSTKRKNNPPFDFSLKSRTLYMIKVVKLNKIQNKVS